MKALIWIIILVLIGLGVWWLVREPAPAGVTDNTPENTIGVETDSEVDLGAFQDKG